MQTLYTRTDIDAQGGTQFASEIKYFLALDEFQKKYQKGCDYKNKDAKKDFITFVGHVVLLGTDSDSLFTKNFSKSLSLVKDEPDFKINSNFFSTSACNIAKQTPEKEFNWPKRAPELISIKNTTITINESGYKNFFSTYLSSSNEKCAILLLWLSRFAKFNSESTCYTDILSFLKAHYSDELLNCLQVSNSKTLQEITNLLRDIKTSENICKLNKKELGILCEINIKQIIYYGVPGSGKSHKIDNIINKTYSDENERAEYTKRIVFHPEYSNADFVGQIMPSLESDGISYKFKSGPFTKILIEAFKNPDKACYLIIEEINRGNAAAIFGDIFQLLDRDSSGWSLYSIDNIDINDEVRKNIPKLGWTENTGIRLPPNLSLLATMNTSDQNVFTLDNAFQRRWDMQLVENTFGTSEEESIQRDAEIEDVLIEDNGVTWEEFQRATNELISEKSNGSGFSSMEDKRLGCWFVKSTDNLISKDDFKNKVLKYLWDDAFKFSRDVFTQGIKNLEDLQNTFDLIGLNIMPEVYAKIVSNKKQSSADSADKSTVDLQQN